MSQLLRIVQQHTHDRVYVVGNNDQLVAQLTANGFTVCAPDETSTHNAVFAIIAETLPIDQFNWQVQDKINDGSTLLNLTDTPLNISNKEVITLAGIEHGWTIDHTDSEFAETVQDDHDCMRQLLPELSEHSNITAIQYVGPKNKNYYLTRAFTDIVDELNEFIQAGRTHIFLWNPDEPITDCFLKKAQRVVDYIDRSDVTFYYVTANPGAQQWYDNEKQIRNWKHSMVMVTVQNFEDPAKFAHAEYTEITQFDYSTTPKLKKFISLNRRPRWHRTVLYDRLLGEDLIQCAHYSIDIDNEYVQQHIERTGSLVPNAISNINNLPMQLDLEKGAVVGSAAEGNILSYSKQCMFNVITETLFYNKAVNFNHIISDYDLPFVTEKSFAGYSFKLPFIVVGKLHTLKELHQLGYKSYHPYIDESYDNIADDDQRMTAIVAEIKRLCNMTPAEEKEFIENVEPLIEYNFQHLYTKKKLHNLDVTKHFGL